MSKICVFDVNETLLDLRALDPLFIQIFGEASVRQQWFSQFIQNAFLTIITDSYQPFGKIGLGALEMIASRKNITLTDENKQSIVKGLKQLPSHPEVKQALQTLKENNIKMVTLTNSTEEVVKAQIENAGLIEYFEHLYSADTVKKLKPAKEPYLYVAQQLGVQSSELILIAAHAWDIAGAKNAGYTTAFIERPGAILDPSVPHPDLIGKDLTEVVKQIIK